MARIGSLFVNLGLESASFVEGLKRARTQTGGFERQAKAMAKTVGIAFAAVGAAGAAISASLVRPVMNATKAMDDLAKSAQKTGTSVSDLSKLRFAGALADVDTQKLNTGLTRLNVAIAGLGTTTPQATLAVRALGITAQTTTLDAMKRLADEFQRMPDGARKSALAVQIFGKAGADLVPLLNAGSDGIARAAAEAERLGIVLDTKTAKAAEQFNDNLTRLGTLQQGIITQLTAGMVPAFSNLTDELVRSLNAGTGWQALGRQLGGVFINIAENVSEAIIVVRRLGVEIGAVLNAGANLRRGNFGAAIDGIRAAGQETQNQLAGNRSRFREVGLRTSSFGFAAFDRLNPQAAAGQALAAPAEAATGGGIGKAARAAVVELTPLQKALERIESARAGAFMDTAARLTTEARTDMPFSAANLKPVVTVFDQMAERMARVQEFGRGFSQTLAQAVIFSGNIGDALVNSIKAAAAEALASGIFRLFTSAFGGGGGGLGTALGSLFGGFRADGGPVASGKAYMVGERGPEMFVPGMSGAIIPNGGGGGPTINVDARGATDPGAVQAAVVRGVQVAIGYTDGRFASAARPRLPRGLGA